MSGEEHPVTLRELVEQRINHLETLFTTKFDAEEAAKVTALETMERRLDSMNEIREQLKVQKDTFTTRIEFSAMTSKRDLQLDQITTAINDLKLSRAELRGKASQGSMNFTMAMAFLSFVVALFGIVLRFIK